MKTYDLIIIGAGASGMMAALEASKKKKRVLLIEKQQQAGMKLRITGKGRCNLGNVCSTEEFLQHCGSNPDFLKPSLQSFFHQELINFFEGAGVPLSVERGKRIFPCSGKAFDIFKVLINRIEASEIELLKNSAVSSIDCRENRINGITLQDGQQISCSKVILAAGGCSYPLTGSNGDGIKLAENVGHKIVPCRPALVGLKTAEKIPSGLNRFPLRNVKVSCRSLKTGEVIYEKLGEMSFGKECLEGPIILSISRQIAARIDTEPLELSIDFKPGLNNSKITQKIAREISGRQEENLRSILRAFAPKELIELFSYRLPANLISKKGRSLNEKDCLLVKSLLKEMKFKITGTEGWARAIVTQGGVDLNEISPETLESKLIEGLYFAGEVMDLDADTGGYNLQIAFSTGFLAGKSV